MEEQHSDYEEIEKIQLNKDQRVRDMLGSPPSSILSFGPTLVLALLTILLILSWFIKYPDIIVSEAIITTEVPLQKEYAKIDGQIKSILVQNQEKVAKGTPIAILESSANYDDIVKLKKCMDTISLDKVPFSFPMEQLPVLFLGSVEDHFANFQNKYSEYRLNLKLSPFTNQASTQNLSLLEAKTQLQSLLAQKELNLSELNLQRKKEIRAKNLFDKAVISEQEYENERLLYLQKERAYKDINVRIAQIKDLISNVKGDIRGTYITKTVEETQLLKNTLQAFNQLKNAIKQWEYKYVFQSRIEGTVSFMDFWNTYQNVNEGDLVFTIIPDANTSYIAKLKTPIQNSGKIVKGQKVNIRLANFPFAEFGVIEGLVARISSSTNKEGFYIIDVKLDSGLVTSYNKKVAFKQEMQGSAEIITEDLRLLQRFLHGFKGLLEE
ncbi:HlyD family efflux transporter periplasmic adaptor subunit [Kordia sp. TARA_039_SRF]|jgi:multidrug efflux pump subunit AcrA (membrane-fusion protein)|nr:HlyD family efflux transporter periplasmic adaptor subunit [Kordia sp. TARA_039_SRF]